MQTLLLVHLLLVLLAAIPLPSAIAFCIRGWPDKNKPPSSPAFSRLGERNKNIMMDIELSCSNALSETLYGLVGCISEHLAPSTLNEAVATLEKSRQSSCMSKESSPSTHAAAAKPSSPSPNIERRLSDSAIRTAQAMCLIGNDTTLKRKQTWQALQEAAGLLQDLPRESNALAIASVFGALSLMQKGDAKAAASALSSTVSRNKAIRLAGNSIANHLLRALLVHSSYSHELNLNTITHFAKAFKLTDEHEPGHAALAADAIRFSLGDEITDETAMEVGQEAEAYERKKQRVSAALALACQVRPWPTLSPVVLVEAAIPLEFWHSAEEVCASAYKASIQSTATTKTENNNTTCTPLSAAVSEAVTAVETLIDAAMEDHMYRLADTIATNLYQEGGKSRYIEARFHHACDTIAKVIAKRQLPIIERQVERVDKAVAKVESSNVTTIAMSEASQEIRNFALRRLEEATEVDAAHRLASLWGMDYVYDEQAVLKAMEARRKRYLQLDDVLPGSSPELISTPAELRDAFHQFRDAPYEYGPFGLDAEWEEDTKGAAVLQLANAKQVLLIDIPALSATEEGTSALKDTVGTLLDCAKSVVVGFACRQDLSRLRGSPCAKTEHWLSGTCAVVDAQKLVAGDEPKLKHLGLARVCQHYFGKPLDKSEQCSLWSTRPLSENQRVYAALDAWACVGVYEKLFPERSSVNGALTS